MLSTFQNQLMPAAFIAHGSPMNALLPATDPYVQALTQLAARLPLPSAILVISAHWQTEGTFVLNSLTPKTIHDFYGFPEELHQVLYPAPGSPECALKINSLVSTEKIQFDNGNWGLDHGTWSVLKHLYPQAEIPVLQLSLDTRKTPTEHYALAAQLKELRKMGVLILGSGNIVHNLRKISFTRNAQTYDWASEFDLWAKTALENRDDRALTENFHSSEAGRLSVPTLEHYLPLLYVLGASDKNEPVRFIYEELQNASISMRSFVVPGT